MSPAVPGFWYCERCGIPALIQVLQAAYHLLLAIPARRRTRVEERRVGQAARGAVAVDPVA